MTAHSTPTASTFPGKSLALHLSDQFRIARHVFLVGAPLGILVGAAVAAYDYIVNVVLWEHFVLSIPSALLCLLPLAGMFLTGILLTVFRVPTSSMADEVVGAYHKPDKGIHYKTALPKLAASITTMGFGASAGMEGASKWLGGTISSLLQRRLNSVSTLRWLHGREETTLLAGAAAGISAIFRAPLTGAIMGIESPFRHDLAHEALAHGLVAAATSYATFAFLRPATPYFPIHFTYAINATDLLLSIPLGLLGGFTSHFFLALLAKLKALWAQWQVHRVLKLSAGGLIVSLVAFGVNLVLGSPLTLHSGLPVANALLNGQYPLMAILLILFAKILATCFTFGTGGVGGLFVPSATIGAALGATFDAVFHPSHPGVFTLIGIAAFTGASYNSLLFAAVFVAEASGSPSLVVPSLIASTAAFLVSAGFSNSESQRHSRALDKSMLAAIPCREWMTSGLHVTRPEEKLTSFIERLRREHLLQELPVVDAAGTFLGMATLKAAQTVPESQWDNFTIREIIDRTTSWVYADSPVEQAEKRLARGDQRYVPILNPMTPKLIGLLSARDVLRIRSDASYSRGKGDAAGQMPTGKIG